MFTFVSGGLRAGKSAYALQRASELGPPPWLYVAPEVEGDADVKGRLARQRRDQEAIWRVKDAPEHLDEVVGADVLAGHGALVLDRFSVWISKRLAAAGGTDDKSILADVERLAERMYRSPTPIVLVTTEVGLGFLPASAPDRRLVDVVGMANQIVADRAHSVVFMISGVAQRLR